MRLGCKKLHGFVVHSVTHRMSVTPPPPKKKQIRKDVVYFNLVHSRKSCTEGHDDSKKSSKTLQAESEELYYKYVYTQGICPENRSFLCRRKNRHSADMHDSADIQE